MPKNSSRKSRHSLALLKVGVISSRSDSEKSVVIYGLVRADPNLEGCGSLEISPLLLTLKLSFSIPLLIRFNSGRASDFLKSSKENLMIFIYLSRPRANYCFSNIKSFKVLFKLVY